MRARRPVFEARRLGRVMSLFYIDTSALVKQYNNEDGSDFIHDLYDYHIQKRERLVTSHLTSVEFAYAILRKHKKGLLSRSDAFGVIYTFHNDNKSLIHYIPFSDSIIFRSTMMLSHHDLRSSDSIQLSAAIESRNIDNDVYFVADDERLCKSAKDEGFTILRPRSQDSKNILDTLIKQS